MTGNIITAQNSPPEGTIAMTSNIIASQKPLPEGTIEVAANVITAQNALLEEEIVVAGDFGKNSYDSVLSSHASESPSSFTGT